MAGRGYKKGAGAGVRQAAPFKRKLFLRRRRGSRPCEALFSHLARTETAGELLDAAGRIDELLLSGEKGMARRANAEADVLLGGASVIDSAAGADDLAFHIFGVDIRFHGSRTP